jgi:hypothetical protein
MATVTGKNISDRLAGTGPQDIGRERGRGATRGGLAPDKLRDRFHDHQLAKWEQDALLIVIGKLPFAVVWLVFLILLLAL